MEHDASSASITQLINNFEVTRGAGRASAVMVPHGCERGDSPPAMHRPLRPAGRRCRFGTGVMHNLAVLRRPHRCPGKRVRGACAVQLQVFGYLDPFRSRCGGLLSRVHLTRELRVVAALSGCNELRTVAPCMSTRTCGQWPVHGVSEAARSGASRLAYETLPRTSE